HQVTVLGRAHLAVVLEVGLAGGDEHDLVQVQQPGRLAGRDEVSVVNGVERATHHPQTHQRPAPRSVPSRPGRCSGWAGCSTFRVLRNDHSRASRARKVPKAMMPYQIGSIGNSVCSRGAAPPWARMNADVMALSLAARQPPGTAVSGAAGVIQW